MQDFHNLNTWKRAHSLVLGIYQISAGFPENENFGLLLQLRRSGTAIASRIAEGAGRELPVDFIAYLRRSRAAASELEYYLLLSRDLGYLKAEDHARFETDVVEVRKMISGLIAKLTSP